MSHHHKNQRGFTLIELLIVISIIGILSTIATVSLGASQRRARDGQRKSDLKQVQNALELYYQNNSSVYPVASSGVISGTTWGGTWANYMRVVPKDPSGNPEYCYTRNAADNTAKQTYFLYAKLENTSDPDITSFTPEAGCTGTGFNYQLQNPY